VLSETLAALVCIKHIKNEVVEGSEIFTDALPSYTGLEQEYIHNVIDHAECYAKGHVHTNGLENFWSLLKRGIRGTYVSVEPFHLFRYLDEQSFRFNERKDNDAGRFVKVVSGVIGKGLRYAKLIGRAVVMAFHKRQYRGGRRRGS
jgi:transposase-like protein